MCRGRRPGCAPGGAVTFFCFAKRKSPKKRRPYCPCPLRFAPGQPAMLPHGVCRGTHCAPTALRSDNHGKLDHEACVSFGTHAHPLRCASRHGQKGTHRTAKRAIAALGLALAARSACAPSGRAQRWPVRFAAFNPLLAAPASGCLRGGMRAPARMLRELIRRVCLNGARQRAVSYAAHPASAPTQVCPFAARRGRRLWGAFLCLLSCRATRKEVARRGEPRPPPSTAPPGASKRKIHAPQPPLNQSSNNLYKNRL